MVYILINSGLIDIKNCAGLVQKTIPKIREVSFINYGNFINLQNNFQIKFNENDYLPVKYVDIHNINQKR